MNDYERDLRDEGCKAIDKYLASPPSEPAVVEPDALGSALRAFCESEPEPQATLHLTHLDGVSMADIWAMIQWVRQRTPNDASPMVARLQNAAHAYMREIGVPAVAEPEALRKVREAWADASDRCRNYVCNWEDDGSGVHALGSAVRAFCESAPVEGGEDLRAKLAAAEKERDAAKREAEAMRAERDEARSQRDDADRLLGKTVSQRDDARRDLDFACASYQMQLADLQRALEAEKKAHGEALRPDEYTRAAVAYADEACRFMAEDVPPYNPAPWELLMKLYTARQRGEPSAPVSSQPPARVLECWLGEYADGEVTVGFGCAKDALRSNGVLRAHRVALPVIETVERGQ